MTKTAVIIGGGIGGANAAIALKGTPGLEVVIINPNAFQVYKYATLRATAQGGDLGSHTAIPLKHAADRLVLGKATKVSPEDKTVTVALTEGDSQTVKYDFLVCATGSWNSGIEISAPKARSLDDVKSYYQESSSAVKSAKNIVVIGGGSVGVELTGELRDANPKAKITIVQRGEKLVPANPPLQKKFYKAVLKTLKKRSIDVKLNTAVSNLNSSSFEDKSFIAGDQTLELSNGSKLKTDLVFWCVGNKIVSEVYPAKWLNSKGQVQVDENLRVKGETNIFALGDITDVREVKMGYFASMHAGVVAKNVKQALSGKPLNGVHKPQGSMMFLPIGASHGVADMKMFVLGSWVTSKVKGKGLFLDQGWSQLKAGKRKGWTERS